MVSLLQCIAPTEEDNKEGEGFRSDLGRVLDIEKAKGLGCIRFEIKWMIWGESEGVYN